MSSNKRSLLRTILTANGGCGCGKPKPSDVYEPTTKPKPKVSIYLQNKTNRTSSLTSSTTSAEPNANVGGFSVDNDEDFTCSTISEPVNDSKSSKFVIPNQSPKLNGSIAIEKDSKDPYEDFRHSMLQMIFEKEIYSQPDLHDLFECFLQLNCPSHHQVIVKVFTEIFEQAFSNKETSTHQL